ncbi:MAG: BglI family type II restriction endonuclease [Saprospiraceae bacterium]|nr:BglI family type II restriction endonuclease [Saprospiraceae bacterium]
MPWGEVGEKVLDAYMYKTILALFPNARFIGLPYGHDVRFVTDNVFVHLDIKSTGPTDNADEVVSSPNQVTGDGRFYDANGIQNSKVLVVGPSRNMAFQPELLPFYIIGNQPFITLTFYLKGVYKVIEAGNQPLDYLELISVPNGLLMFDTLNYAQNVKGLLTPGKDILSSKHKRTRIKLNPLSEVAHWRCQKILFDDTGNFTLRHRKAI